MSEGPDRTDPAPVGGLPANPYHPHAWIVGAPEIGAGTWIGAFTVIDGSGGLSVGDGCDISSGAQIYTHSSVRRCVSGRAVADVERRATHIGDRVFIGANAVVNMGVTIGDEAVVAAGAVVTRDVPARTVVAGVPARPVALVVMGMDTVAVDTVAVDTVAVDTVAVDTVAVDTVAVDTVVRFVPTAGPDRR